MSIKLAIAGIVIAALIGGTAVWQIWESGRRAEADKVDAKVSKETTRTIDAGVTAKEKADEEVRRTPYDDRVDRMR